MFGFARCAVASAALVWIVPIAVAQSAPEKPTPSKSATESTPAPKPTAEQQMLRQILDEMRQLRDRVGALESQHQQDQQRIKELERSQAGRGASSPAPTQAQQNQQPQQTPPAAQPPAQPAAPPLLAPPQPLGRTTTLPMDSELSFGPAASSSLNLQNPGTMLGSGNLLNPDITAIVDMGASVSTDGQDKSLNRFNLREVELGVRSAITPFADGVVIASIEEGVNQTDPNNVTVDHTLDIEEAYINFHTLPGGLTLKAGKFRNTFGRNNRLHTHALPQIDRPFAVQAFLGEEGLMTTGASLSWLVPNPWDQYIEVTGEVVNSNGGADSPILGGPNAKNPAVIGHIKYFTDLGETSSLELGSSYLFGRSGANSDNAGNLFGLDATYMWRDPQAADSRSFLAQTELFYSNVDSTDPLTGASGRSDAFGWYAFAQYQFGLNWYAGVRLDYTEFPTADVRPFGDYNRAVSPYVTLYLTEFLRLRLEYQHEFDRINGVNDSRDNLFFGLTYTIGAHPAHAYWVNR